MENKKKKTKSVHRALQVRELEACRRLLCCVERACGSGNTIDENEHKINLGRRGAQAGPELEGPSGAEDGILPITVSPSPASTSSQEDACKPPPRDLFMVVFSMDCRESFEEAIRLREAIIETKMSAAQGATKSRNKSHYSLKVPMVIVGNKCDKDTKSVTIEEAEEYCGSQDDCCVFVEVSAKRNYHVDELFYKLFVVAGLPLEMAPNHHRKVPLTFGSPTMLPPSQPKHKSTLSIKRRLSDACGVVAPNVRRPSIRTDLMIMRTKTCSLAAGNENNTPGSRIIMRSSEVGRTCSIQ
ncbi:hypothetical protein M0802_005531 [Mischocyttarus mexicanus]|nr:hypothetical protein M0802_005531 [Mischocyttarus mexicanus]